MTPIIVDFSILFILLLMLKNNKKKKALMLRFQLNIFFVTKLIFLF